MIVAYLGLICVILSLGLSGGVYVRTVTGGAGFGSSDGDVSIATFDLPGALIVAADDSIVYVADTGNHKIRRIHVAEDSNTGGVLTAVGTVDTLAGTGEMGDTDSQKEGTWSSKESPTDPSELSCPAQFNHPAGLSLAKDAEDNYRILFVADRDNHAIRLVDLWTGWVSTTINSDSKVDGLSMYTPVGVAADLDNNLYIADTGNNRIIKAVLTQVDRPVDVAQDYLGNSARVRIWVKEASARLWSFVPVGGVASPMSLAVTLRGDSLFVADTYNHRILDVNTADKSVKVLAGDGTVGSSDGDGVLASFSYPYGVAMSSDHSVLYVTDRNNHMIRSVGAANGETQSIAGLGGYGGLDGDASSSQVSLVLHR